MAGYWPSSLLAFLWTETKSRSIKTRKDVENKANIYPAILTELQSNNLPVVLPRWKLEEKAERASCIAK